ncbi:hypothetical protein [Archangium lansingense]|uniref:Uncharacterized protein n=1 Tax=Archangium lansingense TaxID=2995310 RepID=A0ABT4ABP2_9BACT|nr:hypothetical protein [Archangium lansinium]MCY1079098.1 hypothetical protein [Archangium lansinium]
MFCEQGLCIDLSHKSQGQFFGLLPSDKTVPIWDIKNSSRREPVSSFSFELANPEPRPLFPPEVPSQPRILINGVDLEVALTTRIHPSQAEEAKLMSGMIGCDIGKLKSHAIPKIIHRFWTGGPIRKAALAGLIDDGVLARKNGWKSYLWYSDTIEESLATKLGDYASVRDSQREALRRVGYTVCSLEEVRAIGFRREINRFGTASGKTAAIGAGWDDIKYFSDFARLAYLFVFGGIHIDIDMRLGDIDLSTTYCHNDPNGQIPLLGTLARDSRDVEVGKHIKFLKSLRDTLRVPWLEYESSVRFLAQRAVLGAAMFNALIASRPGTTHLALALDEYCKQKDVISGMALQKFLLLGHTAKVSTQGFQKAAGFTVPPYLLRLDQLTEESDL